MEWIDRLNEVVRYIEDRLDGEVIPEEIGKIVLCPFGAFQRTFSLLTGITLAEYIRRRRLSAAAFELRSSDCRVIDLAIKYGYESADAFCVAFKKQHGIAPAAARQQNVRLTDYPRLQFTLTIKGETEMNYRIVEREGFRAAGKIVTSSLENNITPQFWGQCKQDGTVERLIEIGVDDCTLGICFGYNDEGYNDYMVGIETRLQEADGLKVVEIPKSEWLVFDSIGPLDPTLGNTWGRIYGEFLPQSIYRQAPLPTIERYFGSDTQAADYHVEIWIPILKA